MKKKQKNKFITFVIDQYHNYPHKTAHELKRFAQVMATVSLLIGVFFLWKSNFRSSLICLSVSVVLLLVGYLLPNSLRVFEKYWIIFGEILGYFVSKLVVLLIFVTMFIPIGFLLRLLRKDLLEIKKDPSKTSYWHEVPEGDKKRFYTPF